DEKLAQLRQMILKLQSKELIFAFTHNLNSDAMIFYIEDSLKELNLQFSIIDQVIQCGVNLENVYFISLKKAFYFRTKF
ncbi:recombination protein RecR, partial [Campylobacter coli]|nr:recombination protein RecR [Campylobacter coli]